MPGFSLSDYSVCDWLGAVLLQRFYMSCYGGFCYSGQCSQPSSPSVFGGGRDGLWLVVRLFGGARTDYAREGKDRTDYRGL